MKQCTTNYCDYDLQESGKFFTGEKARLMVGAPAKGIRRPNISGWKVFVQNKSRGARFLQKDSLVLYDKV